MREYIAASRVIHGRLFPIGVRLAVLAASVAPVFAGIGIGYLVAVQFSPRDAYVIIMLGIAAGWLASRLLMSHVNRWSIRRLHGMTSQEDVDTTLALDEGGIRFTNPAADCRIVWTGIDQIFEHGGALYFVVGMSAYHVPQRCFASDADRKAAFAYALERLTPEARQRSLR